ncbi:MAG: uracil-DNA glycosylase [Bacteroidota bacterium]|nr:uracil-DNA glycosylase [Bacteroidota bacterium]MDX5429451.1 uracil-DNA glycosylase [Bacteroidota bacterium]MDX5468243.1 uracil-DNA glycosylase [Bacteroidota bacterium]
MTIRLEKSWLELLESEFKSAYFLSLKSFLEQEKKGATPIYPPGNEIFAALDLTPFQAVKVVILGQDPYHGPGQAHGLCFSVNPGIPHPPSLQNIFKELNQDLQIPYPKEGDLRPWAKQGVLLLNATWTVRQSEAGSHQGKGWESFTDKIVALLNERGENLVFMLWGAHAKAKGKFIDRSRHLVLESGHPSPLSANRGNWFGNRHFSKCNTWLREHGLSEIDWVL